MRKIVFLLLGLFLVFQATSQDLKSKNGHVILPEAGDYVLGFDAVPLLDFALNAVNIMNNTGQTAQHPGFVNGFSNVIVGKYYVTPTLAYRGRLGINTLSTSVKSYGDDPLQPTNPNPDNILLMTSKTSANNVFLGGGLEFRRGHNRLQGFYGGEAMLGFSSSKTKNNYEIEYNTEAETAGYVSNGSSRVLVNKSGTSIMFGVRGFVGVEYFVLPKISLAAEFGWGLGVMTSPRGKVETEYWSIEPGSSSTSPYQYIEEVEGSSSGASFGFGVDDGVSQALAASAALSILFHF